MKTYKNLYASLCSYPNLELAYMDARKGKTLKPYVQQFSGSLEQNLMQLKKELEDFSYAPLPMKEFMVQDPKSRKISASAFRDRVVHHALINIIAPIFESRFIHDSFANQKNKGTHKAIERFELFARKVRLGENEGYVLKADVRHFFDTIDHGILMQILERRIKDEKVLWLAKKILNHHNGEPGKGMPLGNLTSQFLANVYLNELDYFVKHELHAKYYIRYVDDFLILHRDRKVLEDWKARISEYLSRELLLELHPEKSSVFELSRGTTLLGLRVFRHHHLLKKSNARRIWPRLERLETKLQKGEITPPQARASIEGWLAYASHADTYKLRTAVTNRAAEIFTRVH